MCRRVECRNCGKPTFAGCGKHVEEVLGDVPRDERCGCHETQTPKTERIAEPSLLDRLFGRPAR